MLAVLKASYLDYTSSQSYDHINITKQLRCTKEAFSSCPQISNMTLQFVDDGLLGLNSFYTSAEGTIKIHGRWLSEDKALEELGALKEDVNPTYVI